jgi:allantoin racemase
MRILVVHQQYPERERQLRRDACTRAASPGTTVEFAEIVAGRMVRGSSMSTELFSGIAVQYIVELAQKAEAEGIEAVVPLGTLDLGVDAAARHVDIPVVGAGRTGYHLAASLGSRVGVIVYEKATVAHSWRMARAYGVESFITSVRAVDIPTREMTGRRSALKDEIVRLARLQIEQEAAEVIFPQGISMIPVHFSAGEIAAEVGVPVMDGLTASIRMAEFLVHTGYRERGRLRVKGSQG